MRRIVWSDIAKQDLRSVLVWLQRHNSRAARNAELDILNMISSIADRPFAGRADGGPSIRLRSLPKWHRRIAYRIESDEVHVISIKDTRQKAQ